MASIAETLMCEVLARLEAIAVTRVRRDHRTVLPLESAPSIHLIDGAETPQPSKNDCYVKVELTFTVAIFVRNDAGYAAADPLKIAVMAVLDSATPYTHSPSLLRGRITSVQEIADNDALRVDMEFTFKYQAPLWGL